MSSLRFLSYHRAGMLEPLESSAYVGETVIAPTGKLASVTNEGHNRGSE